MRCKNPNLQQFPKHSREGKLIRKCFIGPTPDYSISEFDYDSLQARIAAILSGDKTMRALFTSDQPDMHATTGYSIFFAVDKSFVKVTYEDGTEEELLKADYETLSKTGKKKIKSSEATLSRKLTFEEFLDHKGSWPSVKQARKKAKGFNFGLLFGASVYGVCYNVIMKDWTPEECLSFIEDLNLKIPEHDPTNLKTSFEDLAMVVAEYTRTEFFDTYSGLLPWIEECHKEGYENGFVRCLHGARRLLPQMLYIGKDTDRKDISSWENVAVNTRVQNFEIVAVGRALSEISEVFKKENRSSAIFGQIHDAINFYIKNSEYRSSYSTIKSIMERAYPEYNGIMLTAEGDIAYPNHPNEEARAYWGSAPIWEGESYQEMWERVS